MHLPNLKIFLVMLYKIIFKTKTQVRILQQIRMKLIRFKIITAMSKQIQNKTIIAVYLKKFKINKLNKMKINY